MSGEQILFNGIDGATGQYLVQPMDLEAAAEFITGIPQKAKITRYLRYVWNSIHKKSYGLPYNRDPTRPTDAGWGVIFAWNEAEEIREALAPLILHRRAQIGDQRTKLLSYRPREDWARWLARYGVAGNNVIPEKVPYYLLIVGPPEKIPYDFEYLLGVGYAVGRVSFNTPEEYRQYAESVIEYETSPQVQSEKAAAFFAPRHEMGTSVYSDATQLSADLLVRPLVEGEPGSGIAGIAARCEFKTRSYWGPDATRDNLEKIFQPSGADRPPAFLLSASHGVGYPAGDPRQRPKQGALVCQDWPGLGQFRPEHYFSGSDLTQNARVHGLVAFCFACYSAGTPDFDTFIHKPGKKPPRLAENPFVAELPRRLLAHPGGGALAVIGHIDRAWGYSIRKPGVGAQILPFENAIGRILEGLPVGYALKDFRENYAALSTHLTDLLEKASFGIVVDPFQLSNAWIERNDAQSYEILGDPAVRLRVDGMA